MAAATTKASDAGYTFSDYLNGVGEELPVVSTALAGGSVGESLAPSAEEAAESIEEAAESMRDFALTTDVQWAAYQRLWEIGTPVNDVLVSQKLALDGLAGVVPGVTSGFSGLTDAVEEQEVTWSSFGSQIGSALAAAGGAVGAFAMDTVKAFATGGPIAAAITAALAAFNWFAGKVDEWLNGAAMAFNDASDSIVGSLTKVTDGSLTAYEAFDRAFNWTGNEAAFDRLRELQGLWVDAGLTAEAATEWQIQRGGEARHRTMPRFYVNAAVGHAPIGSGRTRRSG